MDDRSNSEAAERDRSRTERAAEDESPGTASPTDDESPLDRGLGARGGPDARDLRDRLDPDERERVEERVASLLDLFGKTHAIAVLSEFAFAEEPLRFSELENRLGIPANTLSVRLDELASAGLLRRESYDEVPPRVEYEPTEKARALFPAFGHLHVWAAEYDLESIEE